MPLGDDLVHKFRDFARQIKEHRNDRAQSELIKRRAVAEVTNSRAAAMHAVADKRRPVINRILAHIAEAVLDNDGWYDESEATFEQARVVRAILLHTLAAFDPHKEIDANTAYTNRWSGMALFLIALRLENELRLDAKHFDLCSALAERGADPSVRNLATCNAVHYGAPAGNRTAVLAFLARTFGRTHASWLAGNGAGLNAAHMAACNGHVAVLEWLLCAKGGGFARSHALWAATSADGRNIAHFAAAWGRLGVLEWLKGAFGGPRECSLWEALDSGEWSLVHFAAQSRSLAVLDFLLRDDVPGINHELWLQRDGRGRTVAHQAARSANIAVLGWLFESFGGGCCASALWRCVGTASTDGDSVAHSAARAGHAEVLEWLVGRFNREETLWRTAAEGSSADKTAGFTVAHVAASAAQQRGKSLKLVGLLLRVYARDEALWTSRTVNSLTCADIAESAETEELLRRVQLR